METTKKTKQAKFKNINFKIGSDSKKPKNKSLRLLNVSLFSSPLKRWVNINMCKTYIYSTIPSTHDKYGLHIYNCCLQLGANTNNVTIKF